MEGGSIAGDHLTETGQVAPLRDMAGTGTNGYNGDNQPAVAAILNSPRGAALGLIRDSGRIYIGDSGNNRSK